MSKKHPGSFLQRLALATVACAGLCTGLSAQEPDIQNQIRELQEQNRRLQEQLLRQQSLIDSLNNRLSLIPTSAPPVTAESASFSNDNPEDIRFADALIQPFSKGRFNIGGTAGIGLFHTTADGQTPNSEFKIDEARLFLDAKIYENIYFFTELNLTTRETDQERLELGEIYVDFENLSRFLGQERWLNLRLGRFDIPFGEEYLTRDAIDNPLITHSLMDFWGIDEGVELYGGIGNFNFVLAVQNGGHPLIRDYHRDKAVVGRLSYEPLKWLYVSASAMRTGDIAVQGDRLSELWFGNGFIRNIGPTATHFGAEVFQADAQLRFSRGYLNFSGGYLQADDNDPIDYRREAYFYAVEGLYSITEKFYAASRFSHIMADKGMPIAGIKNFSRFFFNNSYLTEDIWRLSAGLGYRISRNLLLKTEYAIEEYSILLSPSRTATFIGAELAISF